MGNRTNYGTGRMTVDNRQKNERSRTGNPYSSHVKAGKHADTVYNFKRKSRIRKSLTRLPILLEFIHKYIFLNFVSFYNGLNSNSWGAFATVINDMVIDINVDMASSEDKRLGTYFARKKELEAGRFSEKVLKYLWDDAFKMDKTAIFNENCKSLEDVVITYETATSDKLATVLRMSVYEKMLLKMQQKNTDNNEN